MKKSKIFLPILILPLVFLIFPGCSKKILSPSDWKNGPANVQFKISGADMALAIGHTTITVTGPGIDTAIVDTLVDTAGYLMGAIQVPAGLERVFLVEVRTRGEVGYGEVIMSGMTVADIAPFITTKLDINIKPVVPMIALSPRYREITGGDYFAFDLSVFNLDTLSSAQIIVSYYFYNNRFTIDSLVKGTSLASNISVSWDTLGGTLTVNVGAVGNIGYPLPQTGHYATIYIRNSMWDVTLPDTSYFDPYVNYVNGNYPNYSLYQNSAQVIITQYPVAKPAVDIYRGAE